MAERMAAVDRLLVRARDAIVPRAEPGDLDDVWREGGLVVDTRPVALRSADGELPGALVVERNVLEWRLDPTCPHRLPDVTGADQRIVVVCDEGYASSLAAAALRELGLRRATDLAGGFQAWRRSVVRAASRRHATPASDVGEVAAFLPEAGLVEETPEMEGLFDLSFTEDFVEREGG